MLKIGKGKAAMMAAVSVIAASAALSPAGARDIDPAAHPATVAVEAPLAHAADHADEASQAQKTGPKKWALLAAAAASLAGLVKLIGARRVGAFVTESAVKTARAAATGASVAVKSVGRAVSSPLRFLAMLFGLALFALTGAGLYDVEWIAGLLSGAALAGAGLYGLWKTKRAFNPIRVKAKPDVVKANEN
jgi:hypothetical protein